jgi:hypothetical protein
MKNPDGSLARCMLLMSGTVMHLERYQPWFMLKHFYRRRMQTCPQLACHHHAVLPPQGCGDIVCV